MAILQYGLLSHVSSLRLSSRYSVLVLALSMQLLPPCSVPVLWRQTQVSGLLLCWQLRLGAYSVLSPPPPRLCCPLRLQNSPQTHQWEGFLVFGNFSFVTPSPGQVSIPNSFVSLFVFYVYPTSFWKEWAGFLDACCSLPAFKSCFVEIAQNSNDLLMNLWGRKWCTILFLHHLRTLPMDMVLMTASCTMLQTSIHSSSGTVCRSNLLNLFISSTI